ncbi:MAG TPA: beta-ketoacyl synthase N-terminal-like domain-containing protein [Gemmatimonadales bacterium]|jgi:3-oxoacyl-[acyl-carrier-protein] synthase-1|nr:beta-ketoacyl synthase N-terminal-like domain-containing protein [Gemmatimonadales bacterium]
MPDNVGIVGAGMITAVGLSAAETAASVRAGSARFAESSILDRWFAPFVLAEVPEDGLAELAEDVAGAALTAREARMLRLATVALAGCLTSLPQGAPPPGLSLALPETATTRPLNHEEFLKYLLQQTGGRFDPLWSDASHRGRAGGLNAIGQASELIRRGRAKFMIAGGVDTHRDPYVLGTLDMEKRVKSAANLDGFIPGEGAAFLLLADRAAARDAGLTPWGTVSVVAQTIESGHLYSEEPYRGDGLAQAVQQLVQLGALVAPIQEVYSSMNGENHWAKEWGVARIRSNRTFSAEHGIHHPADCYGDTGAACGPLMVGLAAVGMKDGVRRSPALVYASSDRGPRAALAVSAT